MESFICFAPHALHKLSQRSHIFVLTLFFFICSDFYCLYLPIEYLFLQLCGHFLPKISLNFLETLSNINLECKLDEIIFSLLNFVVNPHNLTCLGIVHTLVLKLLELWDEDVILESLFNHV